MAIEAVGAATFSGAIPASTGTAKAGSPASETQAAAATTVISKVTVTKPDGSTITTITYADGHTETETTPAKQSAGAAEPASDGSANAQGRVTAVNLLA